MSQTQPKNADDDNFDCIQKTEAHPPLDPAADLPVILRANVQQNICQR
jgi:hypothetical protein